MALRENCQLVQKTVVDNVSSLSGESLHISLFKKKKHDFNYILSKIFEVIKQVKKDEIRVLY